MGVSVGEPWSCFLPLGPLSLQRVPSAIQVLLVLECLCHPQHGCSAWWGVPHPGHPLHLVQSGGQADGALSVVTVPSHRVQHPVDGLPAHGAVVPGPGPQLDALEAEFVHAVGHVGRLPRAVQADGALGVFLYLWRCCLGRLAPAAAALPRVFFGSGCHVLPGEMCRVLELAWQEWLAQGVVKPLPLASTAALGVTQSRETEAALGVNGGNAQDLQEGKSPSCPGGCFPSQSPSAAECGSLECPHCLDVPGLGNILG